MDKFLFVFLNISVSFIISFSVFICGEDDVVDSTSVRIDVSVFLSSLTEVGRCFGTSAAFDGGVTESIIVDFWIAGHTVASSFVLRIGFVRNWLTNSNFFT